MRKRREKRRAIQELWGDLPLDPHRVMNSERSYGFDVECSSRPYRLVQSVWGNNYDFDLSCSLGLHCYNFQKGTNFKYVRWENFSTECPACINLYLTLEAMDQASDSIFPFQTLFSDAGRGAGISIEWRTLACRIKCNERLDDYWDDKALIDEFYRGEMPKWFSDEALAAENKKFYVRLAASPSLEIKNVVIETKEEYTTEAREKLKAENAIFYISYKYNGDDPSAAGLAGDHK